MLACRGREAEGSNKRQRVRDKKTRRLRRGREAGGRGARREARERGAGTARSASGGRAGAGGSRAPARLSPAHTRAPTGAHTPAHVRPLPGARAIGPEAGTCGQSAPEPAPTSPPLRSAAARLTRRPRQSCRKMVNDRWKTMGGASQLEDRPRDKPQVHTGGRGDTGPPRLGKRCPLRPARLAPSAGAGVWGALLRRSGASGRELSFPPPAARI